MTLDNLTTKVLGRSFLWLDEVDSTNNYCKTHADTLAEGACVAALHQSAGKGRLGRRWNERAGQGLCFSVLLKERSPALLRSLPLAVGLAVALALESVCRCPFALKWSNDVLWGESKVGGILCESRLSGDSGFAVAGIGVNIRQSIEDFEALSLPYAASLKMVTGEFLEFGSVCGEILNKLEKILEILEESGFSALKKPYADRCVNLGRPVRVFLEGREAEGMAVDIGAEGELLCQIDGRQVAVAAGEASVRGLHGYV